MKLYRIEIRVYRAGGWEPFRFSAPKGSTFTEHGVQKKVSHFMAEMEKEFPHLIFRVVRTGPGRFNVLPDMMFAVPAEAANA